MDIGSFSAYPYDHRERCRRRYLLAHGIDIDAQRQHVYWTNPDGDCIFRAPTLKWAELNSRTSARDILTLVEGKKADRPHNLVVDPVREKVYWIGNGQRTISQMGLCGENPEIIVEEDTPPIMDLAINTESGRLYWTTWESARKGEMIRFLDVSDNG